MATTYKIYSAAATDGAAYIDLPISGKITSVSFSGYMIAGAGGVGVWTPELSRVAINQVAVNNPRGVISMVTITTAAASQGKSENFTVFPDEPVKSGERLYLNCANVSNNASLSCAAFVTIA